MESKAQILAALQQTKTVVLTTHRRDGRPVTTPVNVVIDDGHVYFRTWNTSGKAKRLRNDAHVELTPANYTGRRLTGSEIRACARELGPEESKRAGRALKRSFPFLHGVFVPLAHKIQRVKTVHYELEPNSR